MLRDVAERDLGVEVLGTAMPAPLLLAPIGVQTIVHPDGEEATARAAAATGVPMIATTASHFSLEEIAAAAGPRGARAGSSSTGPATRSWSPASSAAPSAAGYRAIVVTVDTFIPGWKPRDLQQAWLPFLNGIGVANYFEDPVFRAGAGAAAGGGPGRRHRPLPRRPRRTRRSPGTTSRRCAR